MTKIDRLTALVWRSAAARGSSIALLLGAAACQQGAPQTNAPAAVAAPAAPAPGNALAAAPAAPAAPGAQPGKPALAPGVPAPAAAPVAPATAEPAAADRRVRINNNSGQTITLIKGSAASDRSWGSDRIPSGVVAAGANVIVDFNDNNGECVYDLQATLQDGTERVRRAVNVCQITDWTITASGEQVR